MAELWSRTAKRGWKVRGGGIALLLTLAACSEDLAIGAGAAADGLGSTDLMLSDNAVTDAAEPDVGGADLAPVDAQLPDAATVDALVFDAPEVDTALTDALPDVQPDVDQDVPDTTDANPQPCLTNPALCDDQNTCTTDTCDAQKGCVHTPMPAQTPCDDGNACTSGDKCDHAGTCLGSGKVCADGNPCTLDTCDTAGDCLFPPLDGKACDDGDGCTLGDACVVTVCTPGSPKVCTDSNACTDDGCESSAGTCIFVANSAACDDGSACTTGDACHDGVCSPLSTTVCSDQNPCTSDACDPATGLCTFAMFSSGAACDDGDACTAGDTCLDGACHSGNVPACADGNDCTVDSCSAQDGTCVFLPADASPCEDGDVCTGTGACAGDVCVAGPQVCECLSTADCAGKEDADLCNGTLVCDLSDHTCQIDPMTVVLCDPALNTACVGWGCPPEVGKCTAYNLSEGGPCEADGSVCSTGDYCQAGICIPGVVAPCSDGNPCTQDVCDAKDGCVFVANTLPCDDGDACTLGDLCKDKVCGSVTPKNCDDGNPCTADSCLEGNCSSVMASNLACSDSNACTLQDFCYFGSCISGLPKLCPAGGPCTQGQCDGQTGTCSVGDAYDGAVCSDGSACTLGDYCMTGKCVAGGPWCPPGGSCQLGQCASDGKTCIWVEAPDGSACDDGVPCTVGDGCASGSCVPGPPKVCEEGNPCAGTVCDPATGACEAQGSGQPCDDGNACTTGDLCKEGGCVPAGSVGCDDANSCTVDSCDTATGACVHVAKGGPCDDFSICTQKDFCDDGACGAAIPLKCDDGNPCSVDTCDPKFACQYKFLAEGTTCNDQNPCTANDQCTANSCVGVGPTCNDDDPCTTDQCSLTTGCANLPSGKCDDGDLCTVGESCQNKKCGGGTLVACNDGNPCTTDKCVGGGVCLSLATSGAACEDGNACTTGDTCVAGGCVASAGLCDDQNACTSDGCDPNSGCVHIPTTAVMCTDANACTSGDVCLSGACVSGGLLDCADNSPCTADACDPLVGCVLTPVEGATCSDGDACTGPDLCVGAACVAKGPINCDDGQPCTTDACSKTDGCLNTPQVGTATCDDDNPCTKTDACKNGICTGQALINCNDGNYCTLDLCSLSAGCSHAIASGATCDDGNVCTQNDVCGADGACKAGVLTVCNDNNPCTIDTCVAQNGCTHTTGSTGQSQTLTAPGDTQVTVTVGDPGSGVKGSAVATWDEFPGWTHGVGQAVWLWSSFLVQDPETATQVTFTRSFAIPGSVQTLLGTLNLATDGAFVCLLNGQLVGVNTAENNWQKAIAQPLTGKLKPGANTLTCTLVNPGHPGSTPYTNPAGLLFRLDATLYDASGALACDDGNACTAGDWCSGAVCTSGGLVQCDDQNMCTSDACSAVSGCTHTPSGLSACTDGNACTVSDLCANSVCVGGPVSGCSDGNPCTADTCATASGCAHTALTGTVCVDANPCTVDDFCQSGTCKSGTPNLCDDQNPCTQDGCTTAKGCFHTPAATGGPCSDGALCTTGDYCSGGICVGLSYISCDDNNPCTIDACPATLGCTHTPIVSGPCSDGDVCTVGEACATGVCTGSTPACSDGSPCTLDTCDAKTGFCVFVFQNGGACEDGNLCTLLDSCKQGNCSPGAPRNCADDDPCTVDGCTAATGDCSHLAAVDGSLCDDGNPCTEDEFCTTGVCHAVGSLPDGTVCGVGKVCAGGVCL